MTFVTITGEHFRRLCAVRKEVKRLNEVQFCGHLGKFIQSSDEGTNWCVLCLLESTEETLKQANKDLKKELERLQIIDKEFKRLRKTFSGPCLH